MGTLKQQYRGDLFASIFPSILLREIEQALANPKKDTNMKRILFIVQFICIAAFTYSQSSNFYDKNGHKTGYSTERGNSTNYYDRNGHKTGYSTESGNTTNYYDRNGHKTGYSTESGNTTNYYDRNGHKTGYSKTSGNTVNYYDQNGHKTGSQKIK